MGRLRDIRDVAGTPALAEVNSTKVRGDALSEAAYLVKRSADALVEREDGRSRMLAGFAIAGGLLSMLFGLAVVAGVGQPQVFPVLAGLAILVPTAYAVIHAVGGLSTGVEASYERGFCQALAVYAKRMGDSAGSTDQYNVPLSPEAIINDQLDILYKDLDRARQRLAAAGAEEGRTTAANRLHERIVPLQTDTFLTSANGRRYPVRIAGVSQSLVALKGTIPPIYQNEQVQVGARRAKVVEVAAGEAALQFLTPLLPSEFNKRIVL